MSLAHPEWLIALVLLPLLAAAAVIVARSQGRRWGSLAAARLRPYLIRTINSIPGWLSLIFLIAAAALIITAIARPQAESGTRKETTVGRNLLIALDLSRSMAVADVQPDRLSQAKLVIYEMLDALPSERIGLIGFAGSAYLFAPLTVDHSAVRETVEQMDISWPTLGGSNLKEAVELGIDTLRKTGQDNNALVIISDGEKHDGSLDEMITEARESGVFILCIGVGTENGDYVPSPDFSGGRMTDKNGVPVISRLQPEVLRQLAVETKGAYARAGSGTDLTAMIRAALSRLDSFEMEGSERKLMVEFYQWLVLPAIIFLIASMVCGTRWKLARLATVASAFIFLTPGQARADLSGDAREALANGRNDEAMVLYQQLAERSRIRSIRARYRLGEAIAAYRNHHFHHAGEAYSNALLGSASELRNAAHLGMGNTLFQLGWSTLSESPYPDGQSAPADMEHFDALVRNYLDSQREGNPEETSDLDAMIINWADAIRHYDSVITTAPQHAQASHNSELTMTYLKRLEELLKEEENKTQQMIPPPMPENPDEQGEPDQQQEGDEKKPGGDEPERDGPGSQQDPENDPQQGNDPNQEPKESDGEKSDDDKPSKRPNETPEERARRILKENADLEKGALTPGYREFRKPEKDW